MSELDEKLDRFIKSVDLRLGVIERQLKEQRRADERISEDFNLPPNLSHVGTGIPPQPGAVRSTSQPDTQVKPLTKRADPDQAALLRAA